MTHPIETEQSTASSVDNRYATFQQVKDFCITDGSPLLRTTDDMIAFLETVRHESLKIVWADFLQPLRDNGYSLFDILNSLSWALEDVFGEEGNVSAMAIEKEAYSIWEKKLKREGKLPPDAASDAA